MARPLWMLVVPGNDDDQDDDHDRDACDHDDCGGVGGGFIDSDEFGCLWCLVMMIMIMTKMIVVVDLYIVMRLDCLHFVTGRAEVLVKTLAGKG